jgi:hypothetical protein
MPETYKIISDNSEIEFIKSEKRTIGKKKVDVMIFKYVKSQTKLGKEATFTKTDFEKYLKMGNIVKL